MTDRINQRIATELGVGVGQVTAAVELLGEGATVPFIARYRKERTGGLDDTQLRKLEERLGYLRELEDRRATVLKSIEEQGKLTPELARIDHRCRHQGGAGGPVRPLPPQAPHQGDDRARGGAGAAGRCAAGQPRAGAGRRGRQVRQRREGRGRRQGGAGRRPPHPDRAHGRGAEARRRAARVGVGGRRARLQGGQGQGGRGRQVLRLFRLRPAAQGHALAPRARHAARPQRGRARPQPRRAARGGQAAPGGGQDQGRVQHRRPRPPRRRLARRYGAPGLAEPHGAVHLAPTCWRGSRSAPTPRRSRCSRAT